MTASASTRSASAADRPVPPAAGRRTELALAAASAALFALVAVLVSLDDLRRVDTQEILAVRRVASPALTAIMQAASAVANGWVAVPLALLAAAALYRLARPALAALYVGACAGGEVLMLALKRLVHHPRPVGISPKLTDAGWYSFPSGHTMLAVIIFGLGAWFLTRRSSARTRTVALSAVTAFVVLVGLSRVYLGAHWPSDCVGAAFGGLAWNALCVGAQPSIAPD